MVAVKGYGGNVNFREAGKQGWRNLDVSEQEEEIVVNVVLVVVRRSGPQSPAETGTAQPKRIVFLETIFTTTRLQLRPTEKNMPKTRTGRQQRMCNVWYVHRRVTESNTCNVILVVLYLILFGPSKKRKQHRPADGKFLIVIFMRKFVNRSWCAENCVAVPLPPNFGEVFEKVSKRQWRRGACRRNNNATSARLSVLWVRRLPLRRLGRDN